MQPDKKFFFAKNLSDLQDIVRNNSDLQIIGGGTSSGHLADKVASIWNIPELKNIEKRERYIDFGPGVRLSEIEDYGKNKLPPMIFDAVRGIGSRSLRNVATIGGNIMSRDFFHTLYAPLLALDARLEFQRGMEWLYIPLAKFESVPKGFVLSKIRVPTDDWDLVFFKRVGASRELTRDSASFAFLASSSQNQVAGMRISFAGPVCFRDLELENILQGAFLPLSQSNIRYLMKEAELRFDSWIKGSNVKPIMRQQFLNLLKYSVEQLS